MKIALIRRRYSATGGAEHYLQRLAAAMTKRGHHVTLVCENWSGGNAYFSQIIALPTKSPKRFSDAVGRLDLRKNHDVVLSLERIVGSDVYRAGDGVHAHWLEQRALYSPTLGRLRSAVNPKNRELLRLEQLVFNTRYTGCVLVNSHMVSRDIARRFGYPPERIKLVRNGVDCALFSSGNRHKARAALGIRPNDFVVLFVGAGAERKGLKFARLATAKLGGSLLLVADGSHSLPMPDMYAAADVFLLPTLYDPFANVTLEAMAAGLPVVTTAHNGASEIMTSGQEGFVLERADNIRGMEAHLRQLQDPLVRTTMSTLAKRLAQQFSLQQNVDETLRVLEIAAKAR